MGTLARFDDPVCVVTDSADADTCRRGRSRPRPVTTAGVSWGSPVRVAGYR